MKHRIRLAAIAAAVFALCLQSSADDTSPETVFTAKGLTKTGFRLLLPQEKAVADAARKLRAAKSKLAGEAGRRHELAGKIDQAKKTLEDLHDRFGVASAQLSKDPDNNAVIGRYNALLEQVRKQIKVLEDLGAQQDKLADSRSEFVTAVLDAAKVADDCSHAYDHLTADHDLAVAIDSYNRTATPKVKLGPSPTFVDDLALIAKCRTEVTTASIPADFQTGTPQVQVLVNGKSKQTMIWDSGASYVSVSSKTAREMGVTIPDNAPTLTMTVADGRQVKAKLVTIDSIRIGAFTVNNVEAVVMPAEMKDCDSLLGGSFQSHFQFKVDSRAGTLELTQIDPPQDPADGKAPGKADAKPTRVPAGPIEFLNPKNVAEASKIFNDVKTNHGELFQNARQVELVDTFDAKAFHRDHGDLQHVAGTTVDQTAVSHNGGMWLWGVYRDTKPGRYLVVYHTQLQGDADDGGMAFFDVCVDGNTVAGNKPKASEFKPNEWTCVPDELTLDGDKKIEIRLWSSEHPIAVDRVYLFMVK